MKPNSNRPFGMMLIIAGLILAGLFVGIDVVRYGLNFQLTGSQIGASVVALLLVGLGLWVMLVLDAPLPRWVGNVFLSAGTLVVMVIMIELALRIVDPFPPTAVLGSYAMVDPDLGYRLEPNINVTTAIPQSRVTVETNSQGLRDVEHELEPEEDVFRIVVLGDSYMEGVFVPFDDIFVRRLEAEFHEAGYDRVEVINLGVTGYNTLQAYLIYDKIGAAYQPDLVLLAIFLENDVVQNVESLPPGSSSEGRGNQRPALNANVLDEWEIVPPDLESNKSFIDQAHAGMVPRTSRRSWRNLQDWQLHTVLKRAQRSLSRSPYTEINDLRGWLDIYLCETPPNIEKGWVATDLILERLNARVQESGAEFMVFSVPSVTEAQVDLREKVLRGIEDPSKLCFEPLIAYTRLETILSDLNIPYIDLVPDFQRVSNDDGVQMYYTIDDRHWNSKGHALAARTVFEALIEEGIDPNHSDPD